MINKNCKIVLLGSPGSGKGTIAGYLQKEYDFYHLSTGDMLRSEVDRQTDMGVQVEMILKKGELVNDQLMLEMIKNYIDKDLLLLDGFPRTYEQAKMLSDCVKIDHAIHLQVSVAVTTKRLLGRMLCRKCGSDYNSFFKPPKRESICDACGEVLEKRKDDDVDVIKNRSNIYKQNEKPLLDYYRKLNVLTSLDADQSIEIVQKQLLQKIKNIAHIKT